MNERNVKYGPVCKVLIEIGLQYLSTQRTEWKCGTVVDEFMLNNMVLFGVLVCICCS